MGKSQHNGDLLPVMECFHTLQGEGYHQGRSAYFIRLAGCDVGCVWCDVKESWDAAAHPKKDVIEIAAAAARHPSAFSVVTGGEPLMHDLSTLTDALHAQGIKTHLETSAAHPLTGDWDWICVSPKKFKNPHPEILAAAHELKVVVYHPSDIPWAERHAKMTSPGCRLYLQPEWERSSKVTPLIVEHIRANPEWTLSLQVHKYIHIP